MLLVTGLPRGAWAGATVGEIEGLRWPVFHQVEGNRMGEIRLFGIENSRLDWNEFLLPVRVPQVARIEIELNLDAGAQVDLSALSERWPEIRAFVARAGRPELEIVLQLHERTVHWSGKWSLRRISPGLVLGEFATSSRRPPPIELFWNGPREGLVLRRDGQPVSPSAFLDALAPDLAESTPPLSSR